MDCSEIYKNTNDRYCVWSYRDLGWDPTGGLVVGPTGILGGVLQGSWVGSYRGSCGGSYRDLGWGSYRIIC